MGFSSVGGGAGAPPLDVNGGSDATARFPVGVAVNGYDPYWGNISLIYAKAKAALAFGQLCAAEGVSNPVLMDKVASSANLGVPLYVCRAAPAINEFCWFQFAGLSPVKSTNSVAAGTSIGIGSAGEAGTLAAGKQILGARVEAASTGTVVKANTNTQNGSKVLQVPNIEGIWIGQAVTGTGIAASSTVASINGQNTVTLNNAATATGVVSVTFTYTGFNLLRLMSPQAQGAIT